MKNSLETKLGVFVAITILAAVLIIENFGGPELFKHGTHISAQFDSVQDLKVGDRVNLEYDMLAKYAARQIAAR